MMMVTAMDDGHLSTVSPKIWVSQERGHFQSWILIDIFIYRILIRRFPLIDLIASFSKHLQQSSQTSQRQDPHPNPAAHCVFAVSSPEACSASRQSHSASRQSDSASVCAMGKWTGIEDVFPIKNGDIPLPC